MILDGALKQQNARDRRRSFLAGLKQGNIDILGAQSANWKGERARDITSQWLEQYPQVDAIIAANDEMALGAKEAVDDKISLEDILITGFDAVQPALTAIKEGKMAATIDQLPNRQARLAVQLAIRHLESGETFPPIVILPQISLIDKENLGDFVPPES